MLSSILNNKFLNLFLSILAIFFSLLALGISSFNAYKYSEASFAHQISYEDSEDIKKTEDQHPIEQIIADSKKIETKPTSIVEIKEKKHEEVKLEIKKEKKLSPAKEINDKKISKNKLSSSKEKSMVKNDKKINDQLFYLQLISFNSKIDAENYIKKSKLKKSLFVNKININKKDFYQVLLKDKSFNSKDQVTSFCKKNNITNYLIKK